MARLTLLCLALCAASASAFSAPALRPVAARSVVARNGAQMAEFKYPSSETLGIGSKIPSNVYAIASLGSLGVGLGCTAQANIFNVLNAENANPVIMAGSALTLYSFFLHIACFVQQKNGK